MEVNWINTKDKMPEEEKEILFYSKAWGVSLGKFKYAHPDNEWIIPDSEDEIIDYNVTHWMPLPDEPLNV